MGSLNKSHREESGVVLLVVLVMVAILTTIVVDMMYFTSVDYEIAANSRDQLKALYIAKSGVSFIEGALMEKNLEELTQLAQSLGAQSGDAEGRWSIKVPYFPVGDGGVTIEVVDERSKINLNALVSQKTNAVDQQVRVQIEELCRLLDVDSNQLSQFISSLINWLDRPLQGSTNDQDPAGAKRDYYLSLPNPYLIKDGPLDSVEEIKLIRGMDNDFYNKIKDYVTVYPPDKKVNFSTAPKSVIIAVIKSAGVSSQRGQGAGDQTLVKDDIAASIADAIIQGRENDPVITRKRVTEIIADVDSTLQINAGIAGVVQNSGHSDVFSVKAAGILGESEPTVKNVSAVLLKSSTPIGGPPSIKVISWKEY